MEAFRIKSANTDAAIEFSHAESEYFRVAVIAQSHSAALRVYAFTDGPGIARLFVEAARDWKGWRGKKVWESVEGEFRIELSIDRVGHVSLRVRVRSPGDGPDPWEHVAELGLEAGQLDSIASDAQCFWAVTGRRDPVGG